MARSVEFGKTYYRLYCTTGAEPWYSSAVFDADSPTNWPNLFTRLMAGVEWHIRATSYIILSPDGSGVESEQSAVVTNVFTKTFQVITKGSKDLVHWYPLFTNALRADQTNEFYRVEAEQ